jgi:hypothetical protein
VLVFGNSNDDPSAELFDVKSGHWTDELAPVESIGPGHAWVFLKDGRVLVCGGGRRATMAQIYDPKAHRWSKAADMAVARQFHLIAPLPDGRVLACGGTANGTTAEIYDPRSDRWTTVPDMSSERRRQ